MSGLHSAGVNQLIPYSSFNNLFLVSQNIWQKPNILSKRFYVLHPTHFYPNRASASDLYCKYSNIFYYHFIINLYTLKLYSQFFKRDFT